MPLVRKRRAPAAEDELSDPEETPRQQQTQRQQQQYPETPTSEAGDYFDGEGGATGDGASTDQMVKKLVRLALACEYARQPIRRADISSKVLGSQSRQFKTVFDEAQLTLRATFGMEMTELPMKEKVTLAQRRAAQKTDKAPTSSKSYILTSILPPKYRTPAILTPSRIPTPHTESAYTALYTFLIALIVLSGGTLPEAKLDRYLRRTNADQSTPVDKTDKLLGRLVREGYIVKVKDTAGGEESVEYMVGPRGRVEVGEEGVAGLVRAVYGEADEEIERRIERSLGLGERRGAAAAPPVAEVARRRGRPRRGGEEEQDGDVEEDEE